MLNKIKKGVIAILIIAVLMGGFFIYRYKTETIGKSAAIDIALSDAGFARSSVYDLDADYELEGGNSYYEIEFENSGVEYKYIINAKTGEIISSGVDN